MGRMMADIQPEIREQGEGREARGENVDEVSAKYEAIRKNRREFTGASPKVEYRELPARQ
ncbi:MAG: hypothetical protein GF392_06250 [Candidatus Omnitrophica bacterium]|nr:hypothetical protein [Candidatus Omnitrophota bacterium]